MVVTSNLDKDSEEKKSGEPTPELLKSQVEGGEPKSDNTSTSLKKAFGKITKRGTYQPSHKATFVGIVVVIAILSINAGVIAFFLRKEEVSDSEINRSEVVINSEVLDSLGVNKTTIGTEGTSLVVGPDASFNGTLTVKDDVTISGQLNLNEKITATDASLANLDAGETNLTNLNVNGDSTTTNLNLRQNLIVAGSSQLQGPTTLTGLLTVGNSVNVTGNLAVGGTFSMNAFQTNTLVVGGRISTRGNSPSVLKGDALASTDTVSISGNDISGTVAVNVGSGSRSGIVAYVSFASAYNTTPHVVITPIGPGVSDFYVNRSSSGFSIGVGSISSGGHAFDFIVMQ